MRAIGGYFELVPPSAAADPHKWRGAMVNSGRNALEYILRSIADIDKLYLPRYTCEVVLEPINRLGIAYQLYEINLNLKLASEIALADRQYIIVNNYFGIQDAYIAQLADRYRGHIIVDNSQALYAPAFDGESAFYSPRKFMGLADGGIACCTNPVALAESETDVDTLRRSSHLLRRLYTGPQGGYAQFRENSQKLCGLPLKGMSPLTQMMLSAADSQAIIAKRKDNYSMLRHALQGLNKLATPAAADISCPMAYPFLTDDANLRQRLIDSQVFVATYWPNVLEWCSPDTPEHTLATHCLPLPIDQRYGADEMERIIDIIN